MKNPGQLNKQTASSTPVGGQGRAGSIQLGTKSQRETETKQDAHADRVEQRTNHWIDPCSTQGIHLL
jgi:hypothetical protein